MAQHAYFALPRSTPHLSPRMTELAIRAEEGVHGDAADILRWNGVRRLFRGAAREAAWELKAHMEASQERRRWEHMNWDHMLQPGSLNGNDVNMRGGSANETSTRGSDGDSMSGSKSGARTRSGGRRKTGTSQIRVPASVPAAQQRMRQRRDRPPVLRGPGQGHSHQWLL
jgi:hypothetical protein